MMKVGSFDWESYEYSHSVFLSLPKKGIKNRELPIIAAEPVNS